MPAEYLLLFKHPSALVKVPLSRLRLNIYTCTFLSKPFYTYSTFTLTFASTVLDITLSWTKKTFCAWTGQNEVYHMSSIMECLRDDFHHTNILFIQATSTVQSVHNSLLDSETWLYRYHHRWEMVFLLLFVACWNPQSLHSS